MTQPLTILRCHERAAWLMGARAVVDAIAAASGLVARDCADDRARVTEQPASAPATTPKRTRTKKTDAAA